MKVSRLALPLFLVLVVIQLAVPASMIWSREQTLQQGTAFKFRTGALDPYDIFRGRYVVLRFEERAAPWLDEEKPPPGQTAVYALIEEGEDGFARFSGATATRPVEGSYLRLRQASGLHDGKINLEIPFTRYYLEESVAPEAEALYLRHSRGEERNTYVILRVRAGQGVLEELYVAGKPILEAIAEDAAQRSGS